VAELLLLICGGVVAGAFGALLGLGGGVLIVPLLTLGFGLPLREAVGASLVCVIVTSSAAASVYLQRDVANLRLGMTLEMFTAIAAMAGGLVAFLVPDRLLAVMFAALLMYVALTMVRARDARDNRDAERPRLRSHQRPTQRRLIRRSFPGSGRTGRAAVWRRGTCRQRRTDGVPVGSRISRSQPRSRRAW
jgi:uncharacterized membrane protein YfcA